MQYSVEFFILSGRQHLLKYLIWIAHSVMNHIGSSTGFIIPLIDVGLPFKKVIHFKLLYEYFRIIIIIKWKKICQTKIEI